MNKCLKCNKDTKNPKFCSKSCAAKFNNIKFPKRHKEGFCDICEIPINKALKYCNICLSNRKYLKNESKICQWHLCNNKIPLSRRKYCSDKCKNKCGIDRFRRNIKKKSVAYKGGKCEICGYNKCIASLVFHHEDLDNKCFNISKGGNVHTWIKVKEELDKCTLLCANCHNELHYNENELRRMDLNHKSSV